MQSRFALDRKPKRQKVQRQKQRKRQSRDPVHHRGDPPELFKAGVPVVLEGRWQGDFFASDRILIKHDENYIEQHPDRVSSAPE